MEVPLETRRKDAARIFELCIGELDDNTEWIGMDNLTNGEKRAVEA